MTVESYNLSAYDVETTKEVLNWPDVAPTRRFQAGEVIVDGDASWQVVGVRKASTEKLWLIDVKRKGGDL